MQCRRGREHVAVLFPLLGQHSKNGHLRVLRPRQTCVGQETFNTAYLHITSFTVVVPE
jgi:hypothetical protein